MIIICLHYNIIHNGIIARLLGRNDDVIKWKHLPRYGPLWGELTGHRWIPITKATDAELWCLIWSAPEQQNIQFTENRRHNAKYKNVQQGYAWSQIYVSKCIINTMLKSETYWYSLVHAANEEWRMLQNAANQWQYIWQKSIGKV